MSNDRIRAVVFDAVGTLIYPNPPVARVYAEIGHMHGSRLAQGEIAKRFATVFRQVDRQFGERTSEEVERRRWSEIVGRVLDDVSDVAACFDALWQHFARPDAWAPYPDVAPALAAIGKLGVPLAIASNFDRRLFDIVAHVPALRVCRPVLVCSEVSYRKPHALFFQAILTAVGARGSEVIYVGDDLAHDVRAARSAGLRAVHLVREGTVAEPGISSLVELMSVVGGAAPS